MTNYFSLNTTWSIDICVITMAIIRHNLGRNRWKYLNSIIFNPMINLYRTTWPFYTPFTAFTTFTYGATTRIMMGFYATLNALAPFTAFTSIGGSRGRVYFSDTYPFFIAHFYQILNFLF